LNPGSGQNFAKLLILEYTFRKSQLSTIMQMAVSLRAQGKYLEKLE
jgi:hypothetical protein